LPELGSFVFVLQLRTASVSPTSPSASRDESATHTPLAAQDTTSTLVLPLAQLGSRLPEGFLEETAQRGEHARHGARKPQKSPPQLDLGTKVVQDEDEDEEPRPDGITKRGQRGTAKDSTAFVCQICGRSLTTKYNLISHVKTLHLNERSHKCSTCGKGFTRADRLANHVRREHPQLPTSGPSTPRAHHSAAEPAVAPESALRDELFLRHASSQRPKDEVGPALSWPTAVGPVPMGGAPSFPPPPPVTMPPFAQCFMCGMFAPSQEALVYHTMQAHPHVPFPPQFHASWHPAPTTGGTDNGHLPALVAAAETVNLQPQGHGSPSSFLTARGPEPLPPQHHRPVESSYWPSPPGYGFPPFYPASRMAPFPKAAEHSPPSACWPLASGRTADTIMFSPREVSRAASDVSHFAPPHHHGAAFAPIPRTDSPNTSSSPPHLG
jgi:hypothetical protein